MTILFYYVTRAKIILKINHALKPKLKSNGNMPIYGHDCDADRVVVATGRKGPVAAGRGVTVGKFYSYLKFN